MGYGGITRYLGRFKNKTQHIHTATVELNSLKAFGKLYKCMRPDYNYIAHIYQTKMQIVEESRKHLDRASDE